MYSISGLNVEAYRPNVAVLPETVEAGQTVVQARPEKHSEEDNFGGKVVLIGEKFKEKQKKAGHRDRHLRKTTGQGSGGKFLPAEQLQRSHGGLCKTGSL